MQRRFSECVRLLLIRYLWGFDKRVRKTITELQEKYPHVQFYELHDQEDLNVFLEKMKKEMSENKNDYPLQDIGSLLVGKKLENVSSKQTKNIVVAPYNLTGLKY